MVFKVRENINVAHKAITLPSELNGMATRKFWASGRAKMNIPETDECGGIIYETNSDLQKVETETKDENSSKFRFYPRVMKSFLTPIFTICLVHFTSLRADTSASGLMKRQVFVKLFCK